MGWIDDESFWLCSPDFADVFVRCEATEGLESSPEIIGCHEVVEVCPQLLMTIVMEAFDGCFLDCPVHPLNLTVRPGMIGFRQTMFDLVSFADHVEAHGARPGRIAVTGLISELDAVIGQNSVDPVRDDAQEMFEEFPGCLPISFPDELCDSEFACPIDGNEEVQLAFSGLDLCDIEMKEPNRVAFEERWTRLFGQFLGLNKLYPVVVMPPF